MYETMVCPECGCKDFHKYVSTALYFNILKSKTSISGYNYEMSEDSEDVDEKFYCNGCGHEMLIDDNFNFPKLPTEKEWERAEKVRLLGEG